MVFVAKIKFSIVTASYELVNEVFKGDEKKCWAKELSHDSSRVSSRFKLETDRRSVLT